jgi:hypothetical protein
MPPPEKPTATTQPPLHPFANVAEMSYQPPHERNFAAAPAKPAKEKEPAYHYVAPIQNPRTVVNIYNKSMQTPHITLSPEELYAISPEVRNRLREAITPKRVLNETVSTHALIEQVPDEEETSITVPDVYETYINSLAPGERPIPLNVAQESHALRLIMMVVDNREEVEGIIDLGSQINAMSEAVCHDIGLAYGPSIKLNMQLANGEVDQSLGLARNVPCKINSITLYLQIHIIRSPAYDILLGRPFDVLTESTVKNVPNEDQTITIVDPNTKHSVMIPTLPRTPPRRRRNGCQALFEGLVERENDYALVISLDSVNSSAFVEAYTPIPSSDLSTLSRIYLSACDYPDTPSSTLYTTIHTPTDSTTSPSTTSPSDRLAPYTDLFLSAKKKYKPVAKKVRPVIGEIPEKFHIERKIVGNPLDDLPTLNPNPLPFTPTDRYTVEQ